MRTPQEHSRHTTVIKENIQKIRETAIASHSASHREARVWKSTAQVCGESVFSHAPRLSSCRTPRSSHCAALSATRRSPAMRNCCLSRLRGWRAHRMHTNWNSSATRRHGSTARPIQKPCVLTWRDLVVMPVVAVDSTVARQPTILSFLPLRGQWLLAMRAVITWVGHSATKLNLHMRVM